MSNPQKCVWDFTVWNKLDENIMIDFLKLHCKKWAFQEEMGEQSGRLHLQGRCNFNVRKYKTAVIALFANKFEPANVHIGLTSSENQNNFCYVEKIETRTRGPWSHTDLKIPRQIRGIQLRPWQSHIASMATIWEPRTVNVLVDTDGNLGKSTIKTYLLAHKIGRVIPYCNDYQDIMAIVMDAPESTLYIIDMPRALKKENLFQFYAAIETIKDGYAYDKRYTFKEKVFDSPVVWIFTNKYPDRDLLSSDRWKIWNVNRQTQTLFDVTNYE